MLHMWRAWFLCMLCRVFLHQGLPALVLHEIQLLKDAHHTETEEEKISSSSLRSRLLGTLLIPPKVSPEALESLTGDGIAFELAYFVISGLFTVISGL